MKNYLLILSLFTIGLTACVPSNNNATVEILFPATDTVSLFAEGVISNGYAIRDFALSPDGDELFYSVQHPRTGFAMLLNSKRIQNRWTKPEVASFSGNYSDFEPAFSHDGLRLYFSSNRPEETDSAKNDFDIWYIEKSGDEWGAPVNVGSPVNTDKNEFYPSITRNGNLYFTATYAHGVGREDIFVSRFENEKYVEPVALDTAINSVSFEFNAFVSPDEDFIIFTAWGRKDFGGGDMYISFKDDSGNWLPAKNMGEKINSKYLDYCPFVSHDKRYFFFTSDRMDTQLFSNKNLTWQKFKHLADGTINGSGNIYVVDFSVVSELRKR